MLLVVLISHVLSSMINDSSCRDDDLFNTKSLANVAASTCSMSSQDNRREHDCLSDSDHKEITLCNVVLPSGTECIALTKCYERINLPDLTAVQNR